MTGAHIRQEAPSDHLAVGQVVAAAFADPEVADLVDALRRSPDWVDGLSFVALADQRIVGHVLFSRSRLDTPTRLIDVLQLSPLSVAPEHQRQGVGAALVRFGLEVLAGDVGASSAYPLVFLEGSPAYYSRLGFVAAGPLGFRRPSLRIPPAAFQVFPLAGYRDWMSGTLIYSDVFWQHNAVGLRDENGTTWPD